MAEQQQPGMAEQQAADEKGAQEMAGGALEWATGEDAASFSGTITVTGNVPEPETLEVDKNQEVCGTSLESRKIMAGPDGKLKNVVVTLEEVNYAGGAPLEEPLIDNADCRFEPHVVVAKVGDTLRIGNSDPILHNTHAYLGSTQGDTVFNVALPLQGQTLKRELKEAGVYEVRCDAGHTWMHAWIYVSEHPWSSVSDEQGAYTISNIPPGTYKVTAWHESLGTQSDEVTLTSGGTETIDFAFEAN